jgi:hypothetical protein
MATELERIKCKYHYVLSFDPPLISKKLQIRVINYIKKYGVDNSDNRPDIIAETRTEIVGIEHFKFGSSKQTSKGSHFIREDKNQKRDMEKCHMQKLKDGQESSIETRYNNQPTSLEHFLSNFRTNFLTHSSKISAYLSDMSNKKCKRKRLWFFIENTDPLGVHYEKDGNICFLHPFRFERIIKLLESTKKLSGVIYGGTIMIEDDSPPSPNSYTDSLVTRQVCLDVMVVVPNTKCTLKKLRKSLLYENEIVPIIKYGVNSSFITRIPDNVRCL